MQPSIPSRLPSHVKPEFVVLIKLVFKNDQALEVLLHVFQTVVPDMDDHVRV